MSATATDIALGGARRRATSADWKQCRTVARAHGKTFFFASYFLPPRQRRAILAAYAYCRVADDIVDRAGAAGLEATIRSLDAWEAELDAPRHPIAVAFVDVRRQYGIPDRALHELLAGVRTDLYPRHYESWEELSAYCYLVAGTIGLIAAPVLGCRDESALPHAVNLGIAMQLTNILRDVAEDARMDRIYLPRQELAAFDVCPVSLAAGKPTGGFVELIAFQVERARGLYAEARAGVPYLSTPGQMAVLASSELYARILSRIEAQGCDPFAGRAHVSTRRKVCAVPTIAADFVRLRV